MYRSAVLQVSAQPNGQVIQTTQLGFKGQKIREGLGRVEMTSVAGVDDRAVSRKSRSPRRAFLIVAHNKHVRIVADYFNGVLQIFALRHRGISRIIKSDDASAQAYHSGLEAHLRAGGWLIEKCCHDFSAAFVRVALRTAHDVLSKLDHRVPL